MEHSPSAASLAHAIQLSLAPVFLLTGTGGLLNIFTTRLNRILDRARAVQDAQERGFADEVDQLAHSLRVLKRRTFLINRAILCTGISALLVAGVVGVLFLSAVAVLDLAAIVVPVFVLAMMWMIVGLVMFLLEVQLAIRQNPRRYY